MCKDQIFFKNRKHLTYCCTHERISAISSAMISWLKAGRSSLFVQYKSPYRNTASKSLCTGHNIRLYPICLPCKIITGSSHSTLDLIQDQQNILFIADPAKAFQKFLVSSINTAFTLYSFCNNSTGFVCNLRLNTFKIIKVCEFHASH